MLDITVFVVLLFFIWLVTRGKGEPYLQNREMDQIQPRNDPCKNIDNMHMCGQNTSCGVCYSTSTDYRCVPGGHYGPLHDTCVNYSFDGNIVPNQS